MLDINLWRRLAESESGCSGSGHGLLPVLGEAWRPRNGWGHCSRKVRLAIFTKPLPRSTSEKHCGSSLGDALEFGVPACGGACLERCRRGPAGLIGMPAGLQVRGVCDHMSRHRRPQSSAMGSYPLAPDPIIVSRHPLLGWRPIIVPALRTAAVREAPS